MREKGCKSSSNNREVMEAILWKIRTGAPWRDVPVELYSWKTAYNRFNRWAQKGLWDDFFLLYEKKLIQKGYSLTEVTYGYISMLKELGVEKVVRLGSHELDSQQKYTWPPMRMGIRCILRSLGVKSMMPKLQRV